jgi:hypothetical protein
VHVDPAQHQRRLIEYLRLGDDGLRSDVNEFLETFRESGGFETLGDEFLPEEKAFFKAQGIPFVF